MNDRNEGRNGLLNSSLHPFMANLVYMYLTYNLAKSIYSYGDSSTETTGLPCSSGSIGTSAGGS